MKLKPLIKQYAGLDRSVYILFLARIINCIGNFVFPFLAIFLTGTLGMDSDTAGFFIMLTSLAGVPGMLLGGALTDRIGRKSIITLSLLLSALFIFSCAFMGKSMVIPWLIVAAVFFSSMMHPASSAMIADLTHGSRRSDAYALHYLGINIGTAIGPLIAGFLFNTHQMLIFIGDSLTTVLAALLIILCIRDSKPGNPAVEASGDCDGAEDLNEDASKDRNVSAGGSLSTGKDNIYGNERAEKGSTLALLLRRPYLLAFSLISILLSFAYAQHAFILPLYTQNLFGKGGPEVFGVLMSVNCIVVVAITTLVTTVARKFRPLLSTATAALFYAIGFGMLNFTGFFPMLILSTVIWTMGEILATTSSQVYIAANSPMTHRGRFNAVISFISRSGYSLGPAVMGLYLKGRGLGPAWVLTGLIAFSGSALMYLLCFVEYTRNRRAIKDNLKVDL